MAIPNEIPANARVVVRVSEGVDPTDHRMKYRDYVGHVTSWDGHTLDMIRDAAANGSRPEHRVTIDADTIIPQTRPRTPLHPPLSCGAVKPLVSLWPTRGGLSSSSPQHHIALRRCTQAV